MQITFILINKIVNTLTQRRANAIFPPEKCVGFANRTSIPCVHSNNISVAAAWYLYNDDYFVMVIDDDEYRMSYVYTMSYVESFFLE